jgi:hypothetical protein
LLALQQQALGPSSYTCYMVLPAQACPNPLSVFFYQPGKLLLSCFCSACLPALGQLGAIYLFLLRASLQLLVLEVWLCCQGVQIGCNSILEESLRAFESALLVECITADSSSTTHRPSPLKLHVNCWPAFSHQQLHVASDLRSEAKTPLRGYNTTRYRDAIPRRNNRPAA